jgi:hypothetical protein
MKTSFKSLLFAIITVLTFNQAAQAGLLLEPYLGFVSGEAKQATTSKYTGTSYGARVGYTMLLGFAAGIDYNAMNFTDDSSPKNDLTSGDLGVFIAYKFPVLLRTYATYVPSASIDSKSNGTTSTLKAGNSLKLGVGFTGLPFINVNLEYISGSYSDIESAGTTVSLNPKFTTSAFALSISAPFDFL